VGLDWDDYGQAFFTNCVIGHLWHVIPGAHYERMYGKDFTPNTYTLLKSCSDHIHYAGKDWNQIARRRGARRAGRRARARGRDDLPRRQLAADLPAARSS